MDDMILIARRGALADVTLNRPRALNALNDAMRQALMADLPNWPRDADVYAMAIRSASERAFCAGGDVRELVALAAEDPVRAAASFAFEYRMNWTLECFSKPTVALIDGMVMGSGVGLVLYGTHRVAGAGFRFAMPETGIGLFPDVGAGHMLARLPGNLGRYLGLTGRTIERRPAYRLGIVTHCIDAADHPAILARLADADPVDPILDGLHRDPGADEPDSIAGREALIEDLFAPPTVPAILARIEQQAGGGGAAGAWCQTVLDELRTRSPLSLAITLTHLDKARQLDLRETLILDYRVAVRCLRDTDFAEGVRALLIDKDGAPRWRHDNVEAVTQPEIDAYFEDLGAAELDLPSRTEMQALRT